MKYREDKSVKLSRMIIEPILRLANQTTNIAYTNEKGMSKYREDKS